MEISGARLRSRRKNLRLSQADLGRMVGLSQKAISDLETGETLETTKLHALAQACGVSPEWLLGRDVPEAPIVQSLATAMASEALRSGTTIVLEEPENYLHVGRMFGGQVVKEYDVRAGASYGGGISDESEQDGGNSSEKIVARWGLPSSFVEKELGSRYKDTTIVRVTGDSMDDNTSKSLSSGDRVIVDHTDIDVRQGGIFAIFDGEGVIVKQVELIRGGAVAEIVCKSRNPLYDPIRLRLEDPVRIIGRVAGRISRM